MKFLIDTDMGIDDAVALLMILAHPQAHVEAITSVVGNIPLAQATHNAGVVLDVAGAPAIPIYQGCSKPLCQYEPDHATLFHGPDGLGGAGRAATSRSVAAGHASLALIRLARQYPGELTLLTLGPLTNVALAIRLDPHFIKNLNRLVMMAGAVDGRGNTTPPAEFNIFVDPEAAKIVFSASRAANRAITLISWETTLAHEVSFETWDKITGGDSAAAQFVQAMTPHLRQVAARFNYSGLLWPDPLAAAVALSPAIVLNHERRFVMVESGHNLARGQTLVDYRSDSPNPALVDIVREISMPEFEDLLRLALQ